MKKYLSRSLCVLMTLLWTLAAPVLAWAAEHDIIILHTNDIHCGIRDNLGFGGLAQLKKEKLAQTPNVALVDAGAHLQHVNACCL
jgi:5'-nucleotidase / UDP-sugar diphosphatase